jgi:hypothetical protein
MSDYELDPDFGIVLDDGGPIDPHDTVADPERRERVSTRDDEAERRERRADGALSDVGHAPLARWRRHDEEG